MQRRSAVRAAVGGAAIVLAIAGAAIGASYTPIFQAEQILVRGTTHLRPSIVRRIAGLHPGANVVHADLGAAVTRLERSGWIGHAEASRSLPDTIVLEVRERVPVGITLEGRGAIVMGDGTLVVGDRLPKLPRIWVRATGPAALASIRDVAAALRALRGDVRDRVKVATMRPGSAVVLQLRGGVGVVLGTPTDLPLKAEVLAGLLAWAARGGVELVSLDLTVPQAPAARTAGGTILTP